MRGEVLWRDFISALRPNSVGCWTGPMTIECKDLLTQHGIYVEQHHRLSPADEIIDVVYRTTHVSAWKEGQVQQPTETQYSQPGHLHEKAQNSRQWGRATDLTTTMSTSPRIRDHTCRSTNPTPR